MISVTYLRGRRGACRKTLTAETQRTQRRNKISYSTLFEVFYAVTQLLHDIIYLLFSATSAPLRFSDRLRGAAFRGRAARNEAAPASRNRRVRARKSAEMLRPEAVEHGRAIPGTRLAQDNRHESDQILRLGAAIAGNVPPVR